MHKKGFKLFSEYRDFYFVFWLIFFLFI
jgi:hypothetical protein